MKFCFFSVYNFHEFLKIFTLRTEESVESGEEKKKEGFFFSVKWKQSGDKKIKSAGRRGTKKIWPPFWKLPVNHIDFSLSTIN